jgi:hypothetical protein
MDSGTSASLLPSPTTRSTRWPVFLTEVADARASGLEICNSPKGKPCEAGASLRREGAEVGGYFTPDLTGVLASPPALPFQ